MKSLDYKKLKKIFLISIFVLLIGIMSACTGTTLARSHTVTFATNGGEALATMVESIIDEQPTTTRSGYALEGWFLDEELTIPARFPYLVTKDTVLYAKWEKTYEIRYVIDNIGYAVYHLREGEIVPTLSTPTRRGYTFAGWVEDIPSNMPDNDIIINGHYEANVYKIFFGIDKDNELNNVSGVTTVGNKGVSYATGKGNLPYIEVTFDSSYQTAFNNVKVYRDDGYDFDCWTYYDASDSARKDYAIQSTWTLDSDLLLRPKWQIEGSVGLEYTLNEDGNGYIVSNYTRDNEVIIVPDRHRALPITEIGEKAFYDSKNLRKVTLPRTIVKIGDSAFRNCGSLIDINIPVAVTEIGKSAFEFCTSLKMISLPSNLKAVDNSTFAFCTALENVGFASEGSLKKIGESAFQGATSLISISIPKTVETLGGFAFSGCEKLESITFNETKIRTINWGTFQGCVSLTTITLPRITVIDADAFKGCTSLVTIGLPDSLLSIGVEAFMDCQSINRLNIPSTVSTIKANAFYGCSRLVISHAFSSIPNGWETDWNLKEKTSSGTKVYHE